jgi:hypothetical protein
MAISPEIRELVRRRAHHACEYCGVSEIEAGGELTIDHFQPLSKGGTDDLSNLIYCCHRCNLYKSDYWPKTSNGLPLWNPRQEPPDIHFLTLDDGKYVSLTSIGEFTLSRLNLNREALVEHRRIRVHAVRRNFRLASFDELAKVVPEMQRHLLAMLEENKRLKRLVIALMQSYRKEEDEEEA